MTRRIALMTAAGAWLFMVLSGCTATDGPNQTEYTATGTVIIEGGSSEFCMSVLESYPPQCGGGVMLAGWSWDGLDEATYESSNNVRWGYFQLFGTYNDDPLRPPIGCDTGLPASRLTISLCTNRVA